MMAVEFTMARSPLRILGLILSLAWAMGSSAQADWDTARVWTDFEAALQRPERVLRLNLTRAKWKEVDHRLRRFRNLRELVLDKNRIDTLPPWMGELQTVERLSVRSNRIRTIPPSV